MDRPRQTDRRDRSAPFPVDDPRAAPACRAAYSVSDDVAGADAARRQLRERGIAPIESDELIEGLLAPGERVVAVRHGVSLERRKGLVSSGRRLWGDLYVTTRRLVHLGRCPVEYLLDDIREAVVAPGVLRLVVGENRGVEIEVVDPRVLRVEIAGVRELARASARAMTAEAGTAGKGPRNGYPSR